MFEKAKEELTATVIICNADAELVDKWGFRDDLHEGRNDLSWEQAGLLVDRMRGRLMSVRKYEYKRFRSVMMQVVMAFGPDFEKEFLS